MSDLLPLPLKLQIARLEHFDDDRMLHEVQIGLAGLRLPLFKVDVESIFGELPHVKTFYLGEWHPPLPDRVRGHLIFLSFELLFAKLMDGGGTQYMRQFSCARQWIEHLFLREEAQQICEFLGFHAIVGLTARDESILQID